MSIVVLLKEAGEVLNIILIGWREKKNVIVG